MDERAGVVLAGGRSSRMGRPKSGLEWHGATLLFRTAAVVARAVTGPVVVVRAPGQELPALPDGVQTVDDPVEGLGPMQGVAAGLGHFRDRAAGALANVVMRAPLFTGASAARRGRAEGRRVGVQYRPLACVGASARGE